MFFEIGSSEAGFFEEVGTVEQDSHAGVEGNRVGLAIIGGSGNLVLSEDRHIYRIGQRLEGVEEGLQVFLDDVVLDQHDIGQTFGAAGQQLRLQLGADIVLAGRVVDIEGHVRVVSRIEGTSLSHGVAVESLVPDPDRNFSCRSSSDGERADAGKREGKFLVPPCCDVSHENSSLSIALLLSPS